MNGIYKISFKSVGEYGSLRYNRRRGQYVGSDEQQIQRNWHVFVATCESLHRDGLDYAVQFRLDHEHPHIVITASGTATRKRKPVSTRVASGPLTQAQCKQRREEAQWFAEGRRKNSISIPKYFRLRSARYSELSEMEMNGRDFIEAEYEHWREMEVLSGQREHYKPGLRAEDAYQDDGMAVAA